MEKKQTEPLLEISNLEAGFRINKQFYNAVDGVSFTVDPGKVICIVGESGCGKSVMSLSIMGLLPKETGKVANGSILFQNKNLVGLPADELNKIRGKELGMIFQEPMTALNPVFTIGFQIEEVLFNHLKISKNEARSRSIELLSHVGIPRPEKLVDQYPHQLSGGMRQRVMIAMAIACQPKLLIADEPTTALDVTIQAQILELLRDIQSKSGMSVMLITHDLGVVAEMADEVMVMYAGKIVEQGSVEQIFYEPKHPYLQLLLESIPKLDENKDRLYSIKGIVPSLVNMPRIGCRFASRCPKVMPECTAVSPELGDIGDSHKVRCLLYHQSQPNEIAEASL
ncbi:peptide ABC transporter ATP-binding protein [Brevibacillus laterosporus]|uniref:ABC transporter ATP-binding protein n=1 Tax=Brevibacillus laterosporus TaxID=1465 RepID=UPI000CE3A2CA|nr:ABC transporter ATP-binding protein [Brevibacillus laterosporus]PPA83110.1 peptide ABC transporter ATP-binding protein [Brevibacillus laterosporus]